MIVAIRPTEDRSLIINGLVTAELVDIDGNPVSYNESVLESVQGTLTEPLDVTKTASFALKVLLNYVFTCLKVMKTSDGSRFRLRFLVQYHLKDVGQVEEVIFSRPFTVNSNRKKNASSAEMKPIVFALKPEYGESDTDTEVWIKGGSFFKPCVVVGERYALITEVRDNLLTVIVPKRPELIGPLNVKVKVQQ